MKGACDGFCVMPPYIPGSHDDFCNMVVPELQRRGLFRKEYEGRPCASTSACRGPRAGIDRRRRRSERREPRRPAGCASSAMSQKPWAARAGVICNAASCFHRSGTPSHRPAIRISLVPKNERDRRAAAPEPCAMRSRGRSPWPTTSAKKRRVLGKRPSAANRRTTASPIVRRNFLLGAGTAVAAGLARGAGRGAGSCGGHAARRRYRAAAHAERDRAAFISPRSIR